MFMSMPSIIYMYKKIVNEVKGERNFLNSMCKNKKDNNWSLK